MKVKLTTSLAGDGFSYRFGEIVDRDELQAKIGSGVENVSVPVAEAKTERAVKQPVAKETR
jgi:hypothetical protein